MYSSRYKMMNSVFMHLILTGTIKPNKNAPKIASTPNSAVLHADINRSSNVNANRFPLILGF